MTYAKVGICKKILLLQRPLLIFSGLQYALSRSIWQLQITCLYNYTPCGRSTIRVEIKEIFCIQIIMELKTDNQCDGTRVLWGEAMAHVRFAIGVIILYKSDRKPCLYCG
jgi:hypothetical protein